MSPPQIFIDQNKAHIFEEVEAIHVRRQAEICAKIYPEEQIMIHSAPKGGLAIRTLPEFEGKLNRAVGCGKDELLQEEDLKELELIYMPLGLKPEIHLSPFAHTSTPKFLLANGYVEKGDLSTYWCDVRQWAEQSSSNDPQAPGNILVRLAEPHEVEMFMDASAVGFQDKGRTPELLRMLAQLAIERKDMLYLCLVDGEIAGTAVMALMETPAGGVAHFYLDSTVPAYRGRGVHRALIKARLRAAHQLGVCLATAITSVGDGSARNAERVGLEIAYITPQFTAPRPCQ
ncbi:hypothetical protein N7540_010699 [Penicillium herquei]|nr:hypothetical protein N7540_010699 [Penicillium herquei]